MIQNLTQSLPKQTTEPSRGGSAQGADFGKMLADSLQEVNKLQVESDKAIQALAAGKKENIHETMIAMEKASISFQMMMQMRNKIIEAYQELMRTTM